MDNDLRVNINVRICSQIVVRTKSFGQETEKNDPDHEEGHELFDIYEALPNKVHKKSHLLLNSQILENLNDNVGNDNNIQENVENNPEVNIKLTVHSNELRSCSEEPNDKIGLEAKE